MASFPVRNSGFARWLVDMGEAVVPVPHVGEFKPYGMAPFRLVVPHGQKAARKAWYALFWAYHTTAGPNTRKCDCCRFLRVTTRPSDDPQRVTFETNRLTRLRGEARRAAENPEPRYERCPSWPDGERECNCGACYEGWRRV